MVEITKLMINKTTNIFGSKHENILLDSISASISTTNTVDVESERPFEKDTDL